METLLELAEPWAYVVIAALAAAESGAMVGLFLPGETIMLLGGVLVFQGNAEAVPMVLSAWLGGAAGDAFSFFLGRRYGDRIKRTWLGRKIGPERWQRSSAYLDRHGWKAVFFGRFVGVFRALLPPLAGASTMPARTFFTAVLPAGFLFGGGFVLLGVAAGGSWRLIDHWAGRASAVVAVVAVVVGATIFTARWVRTHRQRLLATINGIPFVRRLSERHGERLRGLWARWGAGGYGLYLAVAAVAIGLGTLALGQLIDEVVEGGELRPADSAVLDFFVEHRSDTVTPAMKLLAAVGAWQLVVPVIIAAGAVAMRLKHQRRLLAFTVAASGAFVLAEFVRSLVTRRSPPVEALVDQMRYSFPDLHAVGIGMLCAVAALLLSRERGWGVSVVTWAAVVPVGIVAGIARMYLGAAWSSDVIAGLLLGGVWTLVCYTAIDMIPRRPGSRAR